MSEDAHDGAAIEFTDSDGVHWEVREIPAPVLRDGDPAAAFGEYAMGWLLFSSHLLRKRLTNYPDDWRSMSPFELEKWCWRAKAERRPGTGTGQTPAFGVAPVADPNSRSRE
jgi:hypothetical protein